MIKKIINFILNFVMSILVLVVISIIIISNTVFNKEYIKQKLFENKFYDRAYSDIKEDFENYTMQSGLELDILNDLFSKDKVIDDINSKIDSIYSGNKIEIETDSIRNELDARINRELEKNSRFPSNEEKDSIKKYEDAIIDSYNNGILYGYEIDLNQEILKNIQKYCILGIVIISIILIIINKSFLKYSACIGINLIFSGIIFILLRVLIEKRIQHILILDAKFSWFLVNGLNDIILRFFKAGIVAISIGFALIVFGSLEKIQKTIENKKD